MLDHFDDVLDRRPDDLNLRRELGTTDADWQDRLEERKRQAEVRMKEYR